MTSFLNSKEIIKGIHKKAFCLPYSKSYTNRLLILAALGKINSIQNYSKSTDSLELLEALKLLGLKIDVLEDELVFHNSFFDCLDNKASILTVKDGGTTARFLMALLSLGHKKYELHLGRDLSRRPWSELVDYLEIHNVKIKKHEKGFTIQGPIKKENNVRELNGIKSSQFYSALKLIGRDINYSQSGTSKSYAKLTDYLCESTAMKTQVSPDSSSLSFLVSSSFLCEDLIIENYRKRDSYQPDDAIFDLLDINYTFNQNGLLLKKQEGIFKKNIVLDCKVHPDLVPGVLPILLKNGGENKIINTDILTYKESNRLAEILKLFQLLGIQYSLNNQELNFVGQNKNFDWFFYDGPKDHRMIMCAAIIMRFNNGGKLSNTNCVEKSFPKFWKFLDL